MIRDYFYNDFQIHLHHVAASKKPEDNLGEMIKIIGKHEWADFEKDMQKVPTEKHAEFLLSFFMIVLSDQAIYTHEHDSYYPWRKNTNFPKFGTWSFGLINHNPLLILAKADTDAELSSRVIAMMPEFAKFLAEETQEYFAKIFGDKVDVKEYFAAILNDNGYKIASQKPEDEELRNSKTVAAFKQCFEAELKAQGFI